jgi:hypothetical protein
MYKLIMFSPKDKLLLLTQLLLSTIFNLKFFFKKHFNLLTMISL